VFLAVDAGPGGIDNEKAATDEGVLIGSLFLPGSRYGYWVFAKLHFVAIFDYDNSGAWAHADLLVGPGKPGDPPASSEPISETGPDQVRGDSASVHLIRPGDPSPGADGMAVSLTAVSTLHSPVRVDVRVRDSLDNEPVFADLSVWPDLRWERLRIAAIAAAHVSAGKMV